MMPRSWAYSSPSAICLAMCRAGSDLKSRLPNANGGRALKEFHENGRILEECRFTQFEALPHTRRLPVEADWCSSAKTAFVHRSYIGAGETPNLYYVFDVMILAGRDLVSESLKSRREVLQSDVLSKLAEPIRESPTFNASLADLVRSVKAQGLEGLVGKRLDSRYEAGMRSGAWRKMRVNQGQEFVIGGYTPTARISTRCFPGITKTTS
jgi:hypothetical protein